MPFMNISRSSILEVKAGFTKALMRLLSLARLPG